MERKSIMELDEKIKYTIELIFNYVRIGYTIVIGDLLNANYTNLISEFFYQNLPETIKSQIEFDSIRRYLGKSMPDWNNCDDDCDFLFSTAVRFYWTFPEIGIFEKYAETKEWTDFADQYGFIHSEKKIEPVYYSLDISEFLDDHGIY